MLFAKIWPKTCTYCNAYIQFFLFDPFEQVTWDDIDLYYGHKALVFTGCLKCQKYYPCRFIDFVCTQNGYFARLAHQARKVELFDFDVTWQTCDVISNLQVIFLFCSESSPISHGVWNLKSAQYLHSTYISGVATGGGGQAGQLAPKPPIGHPVRSMQIRGKFVSERNGGRFTGFAQTFYMHPARVKNTEQNSLTKLHKNYNKHVKLKYLLPELC